MLSSLVERKFPVARSLSVLLPVKNAQSTLADTVHDILEVVSEVSEQVELLIIDDGSVDATSEVASELTRDYPQVRAFSQGHSLGREAAIRTALKKSTGSISLIYAEDRGTPLGEVVKKLQSNTDKGTFYFRIDPVQNMQCMKLIDGTRTIVNVQSTKRSIETPKPITTRPTRPNFLEHFRRLITDE
jgi:hypothetical protein